MQCAYVCFACASMSVCIDCIHTISIFDKYVVCCIYSLALSLFDIFITFVLVYAVYSVPFLCCSLAFSYISIGCVLLNWINVVHLFIYLFFLFLFEFEEKQCWWFGVYCLPGLASQLIMPQFACVYVLASFYTHTRFFVFQRCLKDCTYMLRSYMRFTSMKSFMQL